MKECEECQEPVPDNEGITLIDNSKKEVKVFCDLDCLTDYCESK